MIKILLLVSAFILPLSQTNISGYWEGKLAVSGVTIRLGFEFRNVGGKYEGELSSPDQGVGGLPLSEIAFDGKHLKAVSKAVGGEFEGDLSADGKEFVGEWRQSGTVLKTTLVRSTKPVQKPRPQEPKPPLPYSSIDVTYPNNKAGNRLAGTLTIPKGSGPFPCAILISGSGGQDRDEALMGHRPFLVLADYLTRRGIAVLRFDDRGIGKSTGNHGVATSADFATDVEAGIAYLKTRKEINGKRIGLIGHSEGGLIAPMITARDRTVAFAVLMAGPGVRGLEIIVEQSALISKAVGVPDAETKRNGEMQKALFAILIKNAPVQQISDEAMAFMSSAYDKMTDAAKAAAGPKNSFLAASVKPLATPWMLYFLKYDPRPSLKLTKCPVLAINGSLDLQVPPAQSLPEIKKALTQGGNRKFKIVELAGLNHLFQKCKTGSPSEYQKIDETINPVALKTIGDWILGVVKQ